jgi:hypothetical protein
MHPCAHSTLQTCVFLLRPDVLQQLRSQPAYMQPRCPATAPVYEGLVAATSGFVPLQDSAGPYAGLLVVSVLLQEVFRYALWLIHK